MFWGGPALKITKVKFYGLQYRLAEPLRFSLGDVWYRNFALVKVETDEGISGWGETFVNFPPWALEERKITVEKAVAPLLIGQDPLQPEFVTRRMEQTLSRLALQWGAWGPIRQAIAAVDIAMWDIKGKTLGLPVYRLLGAERASRIPLYATGLDVKRLTESALECLDQGFRAVKVRLGFGEERDLQILRSVCEAVAGKGKVYVDVNQGWTREQALRLAPVVQDCGAAWLEEPVACDDLEGMAMVASVVKIPLAAGENYFSAVDFEKAVKLRAINVGMPDITRCCGFTGARDIVSVLSSAGVAYSPHHFGTEIGFVASLHLMTAFPSNLEMLRDVSYCPVKWEVVGGISLVRDGYATIPDGPGLGIEVDEGAVERYSV